MGKTGRRQRCGYCPSRGLCPACDGPADWCQQHGQPMRRCLDYGKTHVIPNTDDAGSRP